MLHRGNSERWKKNGDFSDEQDETCKKPGLGVDGTTFSDQDSMRSSRSFRHHSSKWMIYSSILNMLMYFCMLTLHFDLCITLDLSRSGV